MQRRLSLRLALKQNEPSNNEGTLSFHQDTPHRTHVDTTEVMCVKQQCGITVTVKMRRF